MSDQTVKSAEGQSAPAPVKPKPARNPARLVIVIVVVLLTLAAVAIAIPWGSYRYKHIVLSDACVKGNVTKLGGRLDGRVKSIEVENGQHVTKGQVLLTFEDGHQLAAIQRETADLDSATKELESEKRAIEQQRRRLILDLERVKGMLKKSAGQLQADRVVFTNMQKRYERFLPLAKDKAVSELEMDRVTGDRDRAQANVNASEGTLESAESNYDKAMNELEGLQVREARLPLLSLKIKGCQARLASTQNDLEAMVIKAPEDGKVVQRIVEVGGSAKVGEPLISLWVGRAWVQAWVDERDLKKFKVGSPAEVSLDSAPNRKLAGRVEAIELQGFRNSQAGPDRSFVRASTMVPVRIALEEDNSNIRLDLSAMVGIEKDSGSSSKPASSTKALTRRSTSTNVLDKANP